MDGTQTQVLMTDSYTANRVIFGWLARKVGWRFNIPLAVTVLVVMGLLAYLGYFSAAQLEGKKFEENTLLPYFISALYIASVILLCETVVQRFMAKLHHEIIPAMKSPADRDALMRRRSMMYNVNRQVYFGLAFTVSVHVLFIIPDPALLNVYGWGLIAANLAMNFFHGVCVYFLYSYVAWMLNELPRYEFQLYPLDPSSSEVLHVLAGMFNYILYGSVAMMMIMTIVFVRFHVFERVSVYISLVVMWVTATIIFTFNQVILARIIQKGKWETLNKLQAEIVGLQTKETVPSPDTLGHIEKLVALHNSVKSTPDSALSLRSFLEFLNSLFLPTVSVFISTVNDVQGLIEKYFPR